jgi:hypothetical protein
MILITDEARDYLLAKDGAAHLSDSYLIGVCCGRINFCPSVIKGVPKNQGKYREMTINKIRLFLPLSFTAPCDLTINVQKFLGISTLHIEGWKLI